jgi:hypothetical protein
MKIGGKVRVFAAACVASLVGNCAAQQQATAPPPAPITCQAGTDCDAKWSRAIGWLASNSRWKIQNQTDMLVQTYNSVDDSPNPGFTVTKVATGQPGVYQLNFDGGCANILGCIPTVAESRASFATFVNAGTPAPAKLVWVRKDHRRISGNPALEKQYEGDHKKCEADASLKGQSGNPAFVDAFKTCMDARRYDIMQEEEANRIVQ